MFSHQVKPTTRQKVENLYYSAKDVSSGLLKTFEEITNILPKEIVRIVLDYCDEIIHLINLICSRIFKNESWKPIGKLKSFENIQFLIKFHNYVDRIKLDDSIHSEITDVVSSTLFPNLRRIDDSSTKGDHLVEALTVTPSCRSLHITHRSVTETDLETLLMQTPRLKELLIKLVRRTTVDSLVNILKLWRWLETLGIGAQLRPGEMSRILDCCPIVHFQLAGFPVSVAEIVATIEKAQLKQDGLQVVGLGESDSLPHRLLSGTKHFRITHGLYLSNGTLLPALAKFSSVEVLDLSGITFPMRELDHLQQMRNLHVLIMRNCGWVNLAAITQLDRVEELDLYGTSIDHMLLYTIGRMKSLKRVRIGGFDTNHAMDCWHLRFENGKACRILKDYFHRISHEEMDVYLLNEMQSLMRVRPDLQIELHPVYRIYYDRPARVPMSTRYG